jgi:SAM-dependent methyltransferase
MSDAREVYLRYPEEYDALVRCEDRDGNLLRAIRGLVSLEGADVVEFGAGTGRLTMLLSPHVLSIRAFDNAAAMVEVARRKFVETGAQNIAIEIADNARVPVPDATADIAVAGWTYGHQTVWSASGWRAPIEAALDEMIRVLRPGGTAVVIETLGTGHTTPFEPPRALGRYYDLLARDYGCDRIWIRTDYEFPSAPEGERLIERFFGAERARRFAAMGGTTLPECTGLWWRRK